MRDKGQMMSDQSRCIPGTHAKLKRAWLITWCWSGRHAAVTDEFVAILSWRYTGKSIARIVERYYVSGYLVIHEQLAYAKSKKSCPYEVQYNTLTVSEKMQEKSSLPAQGRFGGSMTFGGNPWLWARVVDDVETWIDPDGIEHLRWRERANLMLEDGEVRFDWEEGYLKREV